jgi:hypothetical protein
MRLRPLLKLQRPNEETGRSSQRLSGRDFLMLDRYALREWTDAKAMWPLDLSHGGMWTLDANEIERQPASMTERVRPTWLLETSPSCWRIA